MEKILIVDDSKTVRYALESLLNEAGYSTKGCVSGKEAVGHLTRDSYDLVITDQQMADGKGSELARFIRRNTDCPNIPIILLSSHKNALLISDLLKKGEINIYSPKPIKPKSFLMLVKVTLLNAERIKANETLPES